MRRSIVPKEDLPRYKGFNKQGTCSVCGELFWKCCENHAICSPDCRKEYYRQKTGFYNKKRFCLLCGKEFHYRNPNHVYCSAECRSLHDKLLRLDKLNWDILREKIINRDNGMCILCGTTNDLSVHHKTPLSKGGDNEDENLETLCPSCHAKSHAYIASFN
jgi:5-methylcytosine-specific restriction endonuclease McrA